MNNNVKREIIECIGEDKEYKDLFEGEMASVYELFISEMRDNWIESQLSAVRPLMDDDKKILEIGCGTGHLISYLEREFDSEFTGLDASKNMIERAQENVSDDVNLVHDNFSSFDASQEYDIVIMLGNLVNHKPFSSFENNLEKINSMMSEDSFFVYDFVNQTNWSEERPINIIEGESDGIRIVRADFSRKPRGEKQRDSHYKAHVTYKISHGEDSKEVSFEYDFFPQLISNHRFAIEDDYHMNFDEDEYRDGTSIIVASKNH